MRNYVKLRGAKWGIHGVDSGGGHINGFQYGFGRDDDSLFQSYTTKNLQLIHDEPGFTWTFDNPEPKTCYFLMDIDNVATLFDFLAESIWLNTLLDDTPTTTTLSEITRLEAQGSPRNVFPSSLGTDGQRLRSGTSKTAGAALNYIGKLYFLTSNPLFKSLFDSLKAGKISTTEALTAAKILVEGLTQKAKIAG